MLKAFYSSATGMRAQELLIDNTANNLANVNTTGFKKKSINFSDLIYQTYQAPGASVGDGQVKPVGLQVGSGVRAVGTTSVFTQGTPQQHEIDTFMAIEGEGFFKVNKGDQVAYTRDGSFERNNQGQLVTGDGYLLDPNVQIPENATNIGISEQGSISYLVAGSPTDGPQIQLYRFPNQAGLQNIGSNLFVASAASGTETAGTPGLQGFGTIRQGFLEGSNVEVVSELVSLITAQRAYEINSRAIKAGDEMMSTAGNLIR